MLGYEIWEYGYRLDLRLAGGWELGMKYIGMYELMSWVG
jgi:hypothetical protein